MTEPLAFASDNDHVVPRASDDVPSGTRANLIYCILLALIWLAIAAVPGPIGDFPLNDDWSYGLAVRSLVETGSLELTGWVSMPLVAQVAWGYLFCLPSGFSFTVLRISTLVLGLAGVLFSYALLREARATAGLAFLGALVVAVNPLYVVLSHSFMTDVPFFAFAVASAFFLARGLRPGGHGNYVLGVVLAVAATLVRQVGVVIPAAFAVAYVVSARRNALRLGTLLKAALPAVVVLGVLLLHRIWLAAHVGIPELYDARSDVSLVVTRSLMDHAANASWGGYVTLVYLGLFLLPVSVVLLLQRCGDRTDRARFLILAFALSVVGVVVAVYRGEFMPLTGNILFDLGLGPATLRDVYILELDHLPSAPAGVWAALTVLCVASVAVLLSHVLLGLGIAFRWRGRPQDAVRTSLSVFVLLAALLHLAPMAGAGFFDRYMIILVPLAMVLVSQTVEPRRTRPVAARVGVGVAVALVIGALSVAGTHDYLSWNRVRWEAIRHLTEDVGVEPTGMDGGFEFNGYYLYDETYQERPDLSWWWVHDDAYVLAFGAIDGHDVVRAYPYERWLPMGEGEVVVLQKVTGVR